MIQIEEGLAARLLTHMQIQYGYWLKRKYDSYDGMYASIEELEEYYTKHGFPNEMKGLRSDMLDLHTILETSGWEW